jgi:hypothetical protein
MLKIGGEKYWKKHLGATSNLFQGPKHCYIVYDIQCHLPYFGTYVRFTLMINNFTISVTS